MTMIIGGTWLYKHLTTFYKGFEHLWILISARKSTLSPFDVRACVCMVHRQSNYKGLS